MATNTTNATKPAEKADDASAIRRKLAWRMLLAGLMIAALLGGLAVFDRFGAARVDEDEAPQFSSPVPVHQTPTQPVTPVESLVSPKAAEVVAEPEATETPANSAATLAATPPRPQVAAQPSPPRAGLATTQTSEKPTASAAAASEKLAASELEPLAAPLTSAAMSGYVLQAGVFADPQHAEELQARLQREGFPASVESRVLVGPYKNRKEAEAARQRLKALGIASALLLPKKGRR